MTLFIFDIHLLEFLFSIKLAAPLAAVRLNLEPCINLIS
jgi:hypothetical protein